MGILSSKIEKREIVQKKLEINLENEKISVLVSKINQKKNLKISDTELDKKSTILDEINFEGHKYYLYTGKTGKVFLANNINYYYKIKQNLKCRITKKNVYFYGYIKNISSRIKGADKVFINNRQVTTIKRISNIRKIKNFGIIKLPISDILNAEEVHNRVMIGISPDLAIPIQMKRKYKNMNYHAQRKIDNNYIIVRSIINGNPIRITKIPYSVEYSKKNRLKNFIACKISKIIKNKNIVLLFEKETNKASESGYYIFGKIMAEKRKNKINTNPYFIIDKNSPDYEKAKSKYNKNIIEKYSFKHYLYIYISKYFISSELSNHVINPRLYIKTLNDCIANKPLIFLQHGIMFAKPVDNPAAKGFYKSNTQIKIYKSVVSSDLEAEQFYRMGYDRNDLIKCGLTKFDTSFMSKDASKIMYMPTYRYWEEVKIFDKDTIKDTTYYNAYMRTIKEFEKEGLLDRLIISCHPKFAEALAEAFPEYDGIVENDISKGLENSQIFITDYSSASYDAHYRGAYIIYDWSEKDYLIENYKAIPPVNEENCDGVPVYNAEQLVKEVKKAIENNYKMDSMYEERYKKINEFSDGKNGDRLIEELKKLEILK